MFWFHKSIVLFVLCLSSLLTRPAFAAEGMFLLDHLPQARLKAAGLSISSKELIDLSNAVVQVAGGGSGAFVSKRGLLITNHHVAYTCLARLNSMAKHKGIMERGFNAESSDDEISCPGYDLLIVQGYKDITSDVLRAVSPGLAWRGRYLAIQRQTAAVVRQCESGGTYTCEVASMDGGASYYLTLYLRVRDVRLVYAPPRSLGKFGGDIDNWMYPRHTADFTFLRAYVNNEGAGIAYDKRNIPMHTHNYLQLSATGYKRGSLALVMGFPARTSRHATSNGVRFYSEVQLPAYLKTYRGLISTLHEEMKERDIAKRKYEGLESGFQNAVKYYDMSQKGMGRWQVLQKKLKEEAVMVADPARGREAKAMLVEIDGVFKRYRGYFRRKLAVEQLLRASRILRMAYDVVKWAREKGKADSRRKDRRYKDKNIFRLKEAAARLEAEVDLDVERALVYYLLRDAQSLAKGEQLWSVGRLLAATARALKRLKGEARRKKVDFATYFRDRYGADLVPDPLRNAVNMIFGRSVVLARTPDDKALAAAQARRANWLEMDVRALKQEKDPVLQFARYLDAEYQSIIDGPYREVSERLATTLHPKWVKRIKRPAYPDANSTVRLSYGSIEDYQPADSSKKYHYVTTVGEMLRKDRGKYPFLIPPQFKRAFTQRTGTQFTDPTVNDIPLNFTTTLDTTGGNSGSPVLDQKGQLIGLLFDGTPESILSDWQYLPKWQRSICFDIRFANYLLTVDNATRLLKELGLVAIKAPAWSQ